MISQSNSTDKQKSILAAALKLFVEFGFHGTPTSKIAQAAGVSNGTLFHYYKTKDELVIALYTDIKTRLGDYVAANTPDSKDLKELMRTNYLNTLYWALDNRQEFYFIQQFHSSPFLLMIAPEETQKQTKWVFDLLARAIKTKLIKNQPIPFIYTLISSHLYGVNQYLATSDLTAAKQKKLINESFESIWKMIE